MKLIHTVLLLLFSISFTIAQDGWKDYIVGRPNNNYLAAKRTTAKAWGIQYETLLAGCVLTDEVSEAVEVYQKNNEIYFQQLAHKLGDNWKYYFELDVKKRLLIQQAETEERIWIEVIVDKSNSLYYQTKKATAKRWGIQYEPRFIEGTLTEELSTELQEVMQQSSAYEQDLYRQLGEHWKKDFLREVDLELAKQKAKDQPIAAKKVWMDLDFLIKNEAHLKAKKAIAQEWGIQYATCSSHPRAIYKNSRIQKKNQRYFNLLAKHYGVDWKGHFDRAVQKKLVAQNIL